VELPAILSVCPTHTCFTFKRFSRRQYGVNVEIQHVVLGYEGVGLLLHNTGKRGGRVLDEYLTTVCTLREGKIARLDTYISNIEMVNAYFA
jgi:uncharacterized protein